jgi:hypothetical protein
MQVFDAEEKHIIGQWFFVPVERTTEEQSKADGKPVVMFREMPEGVDAGGSLLLLPDGSSREGVHLSEGPGAEDRRGDA